MRYLLLLLCIGACSSQPAQSVMTPTAAPVTTAPAFTYLALGDSYTIGESVGEADRWPVQLAQMLRRETVDMAPPDIIARTGWTTDELQAAIVQRNNTNTYSMVSLLIGVNNQYRGQSLDKYRTEFRALLQTAVTFVGRKPNRVMVLSIPDWGQSPFAGKSGKDPAKIGCEIDAFNAVAQAECKTAGVAYIDITPLTRSAAGDATQFADDGLHYSGRQMKRWAEQALPVVKGLLAK